MPIEIKELVIKAVVTPGNNHPQNSSLDQSEILKLKKEITKDVTEKVLKALQQKKER